MTCYSEWNPYCAIKHFQFINTKYQSRYWRMKKVDSFISKVHNTCWSELTQVVACYRHLASCVGGCTDNSSLRRDLQQTRERAQTLALSCRNHLTARLRDKTLPEAERKETELLWVAFSSCLELFHADMCKVFTMVKHFSLANKSAMVQTGIQGKHA